VCRFLQDFQIQGWLSFDILKTGQPHDCEAGGKL